MHQALRAATLGWLGLALLGSVSLLSARSASAQAVVHPAFADAVAQLAGSVFPGPILVPREDATFFDALLARANPASRTEDSSDGWRAPGVPMYEIALGV